MKIFSNPKTIEFCGSLCVANGILNIIAGVKIPNGGIIIVPAIITFAAGIVL